MCAESFGKASDHLKFLGNLDIASERIRRATHRVGRERVRQRERVAQELKTLSIPEIGQGSPCSSQGPTAVCVMADGGRYQMFDRKQPPQNGEHWKESRVGTFLELKLETHDADPTPELPGFLRSVSIAKRLAEIGRVAGKNGETPKHNGKSKEPPWPRPKIVNKAVVASAVSWEEFGFLMASQAWHSGFNNAQVKVFVSDGNTAIEKMQRRHFSRYVSVLDLMHALSYALAAARASKPDDQSAWLQYVEWAEWIWTGNVAKTIASLAKVLEQIGKPPKDAPADDPREVVRRALVYYTNHQSRMNYPEYRKKGYPITSAVMESTIKQINKRVKGTEKFWSGGGAEQILTLRGDYLTDPSFDSYWTTTQQSVDGFRSYHTAS